ncbi:MAG: enoyl-CoA hydratase-related protein [Anaerolineae bacterium]|nr:enoyl-CoA hydratase-related protein [Thermoflexus sp.]MCS7350448.1 enoyl-CoA hydratase-related protein [Thermoflexus sp.]MDW8179899.1 enoyl-CoA hydratase-related protein [Anaerolineae bacterium]
MQRKGAVGIIQLDRPERFNALDVAMARDLRKAALQLARDPEIRCVILAGTDRVFCSGADLKYIREREHPEDFSYLQPEAREIEGGYGRSFKEILEYLHSTISEIRRAPKPFIAAVKGVAAAGGLGLAMACDLVFASDRASFEWAYSKTSLTGAESTTFLLPRLIGLRRTMEMVFLNPRLDAQQALEWGLINGIFPFETFDQEVEAVAHRLARGPTRAWAITKALINEALGIDRLDVHMAKELRHLVEIAETPDFAEGLAAFFEKREPDFRGA